MEQESHHHHPHGTGMRWLDVSLAVCATIVSLVSLWLGLHSSHSMEKLVAANSYPYLELMRTQGLREPVPGTDRNFTQAVGYSLQNNGVGPARVEWVEMRFKGKAVGDITELLDACCKAPQYAIDGIGIRGNISNALIRPGATVDMFLWRERATPNPTFDALRSQMDDISYSACYCSVFEECYIATSEDNKPQPVKQCTPPAKPFQPRGRT